MMFQKSDDLTNKEIKIVGEKLRETATRLGMQVDEFADFLFIDEELRHEFSEQWMEEYLALKERLTQDIALEFASMILNSTDDLPQIESADRLYKLREIKVKHGDRVSDDYCTELDEYFKEQEDRIKTGLYLSESEVSRLIVGPYAEASDELREAIARQTKLREIATRCQLPSHRRGLLIILNPDIARQFILETGYDQLNA